MNPRRVSFSVYGKPATQGSKSVMKGKKGTRAEGKAWLIERTTERTKSWRSLVQDAAIAAMGDEPPLEGPLRMTVTFWFSRPMSHWGTGRNHAVLKPSAVPFPASLGRMDIEKLVRAVSDAMTDAKVWHDDAQVVALEAYKQYTDRRGDKEGAYVVVDVKPPPGYTSGD